MTLPASSRFLVPLLGRERSASEVAAEVGVSVGAVGYRLRQMCSLGLIAQTRRQRRHGRPIVYYRAVADRVFAPLDLAPIDSLRDLFRQGLADLADRIEAAVEQGRLRVGESPEWGTLLYRSSPGGPVNRDFVPAALTGEEAFWDAALHDESPAIWSQHATLDLAPQVAKQLQRELAGIVTRYATKAGVGTAVGPHHVQLVLAPATSPGAQRAP